MLAVRAVSTQDSVRRARERAGQPEGAPRQTALIERPVGNVDQLRVLLNAASASIQRSLPDQRKVERFYQMVMVNAQRTPKLLECTGISLLSSALVCAQNGLELGPLGHAWLIPRRNSKTGLTEAQFFLGYLGEAELAMRSGEYESVVGIEVRERDYFRHEQGFGWTIEHVPYADGDRGEVTRVYAVAFLRGGGRHHPFVVLSREEIEARRRRSSSPDDGPWVTDWVPMARKSGIRALRSQLRLTAEAARVQDADGRVFRSLEPDLISQTTPTEEASSSGEQDAGQGTAGEAAPPPPAPPTSGAVEPEQQRLA